jgi:sugar lactone lactonase YvrE
MMRHLGIFALALALCAGPGQAQTPIALGGNFGAPQGVAVDTAGDVFVADSGLSSVDEIPASGGGVAMRSLGNGIAGLNQFVVDQQGNIFALAFNAKQVQEIQLQGGTVTTRNLGTGMANPSNLAIDAAGNLFVADFGAGTIWEIPAAGGYSQTIALTSDRITPGVLALDGAGDIFYYDSPGHVVHELTAASGYASSTVIGPAFSTALCLAADAAGDVFLCEDDTHLIKELPVATGYASALTLGGSFGNMSGLALDAAGNLFVGDGLENQLYELSAASNYTSVTQLGGFFSDVLDIAIDGSGTLYVASQGNMQAIPAAGGYDQPQILFADLVQPTAVALDAAGNLFVADSDGQVLELPAQADYGQITLLARGVAQPTALAPDPGGNLFVGGSAAIYELPAAGGYAIKTALTGALGQRGLAVDADDDLFVNDIHNSQNDLRSVLEIPSAGGYSDTVTLYSNDAEQSGLAFDAVGNLYFTAPGLGSDGSAGVVELTAASHFGTATTVATGFVEPTGIALDKAGDLFVTDLGNSLGSARVYEVLEAPPPLLAAVLPGSRSVQLGTPATVFATLINSGSTPLADCAIALPATAPAGLSMSYQTTDPTTNLPTGTPNTPVTIAGNDGTQSFILSFQGSASFTTELAPGFGCDGAAPAAIITGLDTLDLTMAATPLPDIIALAATPSVNGILSVPLNGAAAFAIATDNLGVAAPITVSADTGRTALPVQLLLCQTDPASGQCLAPPAASATLDDAAGATPTFSVFVQASGAIPLSPATARLFVRFADAAGNPRGTTSVAVETQ